MTNTQNTRTFHIQDDIGVFDNSIPLELCDEFIGHHNFMVQNNFFLSFNKIAQSMDGIPVVNDERCLGPTQLNFHKDFEEQRNFYLGSDTYRYETYNKFLNDMFLEYAYLYPSLLQLMKSGDLYIETAQTQKTVPQKGYHVWHHDGENERILTFLTYLNDEYTGGETEFLTKSRRIEGKKGRTIIFPGAYTHSHRGNPPLSGTKYVLTGWIAFHREGRLKITVDGEHKS